jgi:hypothetical protein
MDNNSNTEQIQTSRKKNKIDYLSFIIILFIGTYLFFITKEKDGVDGAVILLTIISVFPLSFKVLAIIIRGLNGGLAKERNELILVSIFLIIGLTILILYSGDWRIPLIIPICAIIYNILIGTANRIWGFVKRKFDD